MECCPGFDGLNNVWCFLVLVDLLLELDVAVLCFENDLDELVFLELLEIGCCVLHGAFLSGSLLTFRSLFV